MVSPRFLNVRTATLHQLPVALFGAFYEQAAGLLREYTLTVLGGATQPFDLADVTRARAAKAELAARVDDAVSAAGSSNGSSSEPKKVDVELPRADVGAFGVLQAVLDHANRLAHTGDLLVLPVLPEVAALRNWICEEVTAQAAGASARAWQLPGGTLEQPGRPLAVWSGMADLPADHAWLVGDDANRIIGASGPALELLGWSAEELIGQRIVVVIPPALRELHIASFTRGLLTGEHRLLDQPLEVPAHTRDGRDIDVWLTLRKHMAEKGRCVFLAHLELR